MDFLIFILCGFFIGAYGWNHGPMNPHQQGYHPKGPEHKMEPASPYEMKYYITDDYGNQNWREESGDEYNNKHGAYGFKDVNGLTRKVKYIADHTGFHVFVDSNEPGFNGDNPADAEFTVKDQNNPKNDEYRSQKDYRHPDSDKQYNYKHPRGENGYGILQNYGVPAEKHSLHNVFSHGKVKHTIHKLPVHGAYGNKNNGYPMVEHSFPALVKEDKEYKPHAPKQFNLKKNHRLPLKSGYSSDFIKVVKVPKHPLKQLHPVPNHRHQPTYHSGYGKSSVYVHQSRQGKNPFQYTVVY